MTRQSPAGKAGCVSPRQGLHAEDAGQRDGYSWNVTPVGSIHMPRAPSTVDKQDQARSQNAPWALGGDNQMRFPPARLALAGILSSAPFFFNAGPSWKKNLEPPSALRQRNTPTWPDKHVLSPGRKPGVGTPALSQTPSKPESRWHPAHRQLRDSDSHSQAVSGFHSSPGQLGTSLGVVRASSQDGPGDPCPWAVPHCLGLTCEATRRPWKRQTQFPDRPCPGHLSDPVLGEPGPSYREARRPAGSPRWEGGGPRATAGTTP